MRATFKYLIQKVGLAPVLYRVYFSIKNRFRKPFLPHTISYAGHSFTMLGPGGDFAESVRLYGCYEPLMTEKFIQVIGKGDIIFDIGAAEGYFSILSSRLNGDPSKVYSFDRDYNRMDAFRKNNRSLMDGKAHLVEFYVGDIDTEFLIRIDSYIDKSRVVPSVIKIDVEGYEVHVLRGARRLLFYNSPHLFIEVHPRFIVRYESNGIAELGKLLEEGGYDIELCTNHRGNHRGPVEPWRSVNIPEFVEHCRSVLNANGSNFAIHCHRPT